MNDRAREGHVALVIFAGAPVSALANKDLLDQPTRGLHRKTLLVLTGTHDLQYLSEHFLHIQLELGPAEPRVGKDGLDNPDLVVLDLMMPVIDGFGMMGHIRARTPEGVYLPILVVTADVVQEVRRHALAAGATDFLTKPFDEAEVLLRIENLLRTRWQYLVLQDENSVLDLKVRERTQALESSNQRLESSNQKLDRSQAEIVLRLAQAAEFRDDDTGKHTQRVGEISRLLAQHIGLSDSRCNLIGLTAPLHDVGKIGILDAILLKPGRLTVDEFTIMQGHATIGGALLSQGQSPSMQMAETIALSHHERWNGSGYPQGLRGDAIPLEGQIVGIADVFDALTHARPYKAAWPVQETLAEFQRIRGVHFSPNLTDAFMGLPHQTLI